MKEERKKQLEELYAAKVQAKAEEISKWIYEHPEDGDQEFLSSAYICEQLKETAPVRFFEDSISMRAEGQ